MIELTLSDAGTLCGYAGTLWCIANLAWGLFRNDATRVLIYGCACLMALVVALNVGGVVNSTTWGLFGALVFGAHAVYAGATGRAAWAVMLYLAMCGASIASVAGVIR